MKKRVLVVPAGTEIAHEVCESLRYSKHWELIGANAVRDHSELIFPRVHNSVPFVDDSSFVDAVQRLIVEQDVDYVIPAHDEAIFQLAECVAPDAFVGPRVELGQILRYKSKMLAALRDVVPTPREIHADNDYFPIFCKPDRGQGSRGALVVRTVEELRSLQSSTPGLLYQELLPGNEVTVDCFSAPNGELLYSSARARDRVLSGIATRMHAVEDPIFDDYASAISQSLMLSGAWFFQMKQDRYGEYRLLEVANRVAGSSGYQRAKGVNLVDAWLHQMDGKAITLARPLIGELIYDRALYPKIKADITADHIYVDFDDTVILDGGEKLHYRLVGLLFGIKVARKTPITLITRHAHDIDDALARLSLGDLFDNIIHLRSDERKSAFVVSRNAIFIDDAHRERREVAEATGALCLGPESIDILESLL